LLGLVLLVHAWLLGMWSNADGSAARPSPAVPARPLVVRQIVWPQTPVAAAAAEPARNAAALPSRPRASAGPRANTPPATPLAPTAEEGAPLAAAEPAAGAPPPVYATQLPPSTRLQYSMRRGSTTGTAQLDWAWAEGRYRLSLQGHLPAAPQAAWVSQGVLDGAGVAPERYTEIRRGRELRAVNFQREAGHISFSGPSLEFPLVDGAQDRLSWMIQLGAVLAANPALAEPGAQISVFVAGTRGDAETWLFTVQGHESLDLTGGPVPHAVHLLREPRRPYDTQAHVWLDPQRHYLPVRLHLRVRATGEGTLLELQEAR